MNTFTEHDRKVTRVLSELAAAPAAAPQHASTQLPRRSRLTAVTILAGTAILAATAAVVLYPERLQSVPGSPNRSAETLQDTTADRQALPAPRVQATRPALREITASGYVVAQEKTAVYAEWGGVITELLVEPGDRVAAGQGLLRIEDSGIAFAVDKARLARRSAELSVGAARIALDQARAVHHRQSELAQRGVVASKLLEDAHTTFQTAFNRLEQSEAALQSADLALRIAEDRAAALTVRAPISGTVTTSSAHVGDTVPDRIDAIHDGLGLMTIARLDSMVIDADVAEKVIGQLKAGQKGEAVLDAFADRSIAFEVERVAPVVNAAKGTIKLRLRPIDPQTSLRPGMAARIRIPLSPPDPQPFKHPGAVTQ